MRKTFYVNGKVFYSEKTFKKYMIKEGLLEVLVTCKFGTYFRQAYVIQDSNHPRRFSFEKPYVVKYIMD